MVFKFRVVLSHEGSTIRRKSEHMNPYLHEDGSRMSTKEIQAEVHREKLKWTGTMDADWWQRLTAASRAAEKRLDTHFYDMEKMNALYGDDWYEQYQEDKKAYAGENEAKEQKTSQRSTEWHTAQGAS